MKTHYEAAEVQRLGAGAEVDALAALGMGWRMSGVFWEGGEREWCWIKDWHPSEHWRDAGRLLDEAAEWCGAGISQDQIMPSTDKHTMRIEQATPAWAPAGPLAIARAFCMARVDVINKALEEEGK